MHEPPGQIELAAETILAGGVIAYPTEGVWGLGCNPSDESAVNRILHLKQRPVSKGLILVAGSRDQLNVFVANVPELPEPDFPTTWLLNHGGLTPDWVSGGREKVAARIAKHPIVVALCNKVGMPIISTSANPSNMSPAESAEQVQKYFDTLVDVIVPGDLGGAAGASQIIDWETDEVVREAGS